MTDRKATDRGQLVLLAAALAAAALVPMALAYLTLGAHPDVAATADRDRPGESTLRALDRAATNASAAVDRRPWREREETVTDFDAAFAGDARGIETARLSETVAVDVAYNATAATAWAETACPTGPNRAFGDCEVIEGVVVQDRAGEATPVAVGVDVRVVEPDGTTELTVVIRVR
ncbi:hypothetical protein Hbl1158_03055 [Halobaculum sp. CBA1158]|uniref:DUF7261 family protein n=1 Tax=Halobaculum sp. CBA1158 TaxID=2904243 RepID=UPI001F3B382A|nr:hypothetical protein [Halobaculum sp. CBA1158]UIP00364.1 hypothetical protein Hbl1158_03055 [Halobaculum sp. CBA1158]